MAISDKYIDRFAKDLVTVMSNLESDILAFMQGIGKVSPESAAVILNSKADFIAFLESSGYNDLATDYIAQYGQIPGAVEKAFAARRLPDPQFSTISAETFSGLARIDLDAFEAIGEKAMEDLRLGIYRQVIAGDKYQNIVETIRASTTGLAANNSPLANYANTHANTAILNFNGEVLREAGESIGFDEDDSLWEVVGPLDDKTRDLCVLALSEPVRTRKEWIDFGYWGGAPGGYN